MTIRSLFLLLFPIVLAACGGGGGGGGGDDSSGGGGGGTPSDPPVQFVVQETYGLDIIDPYGFYGRARGAGVTVAVLDSGVALVEALGGRGSNSRVVTGCKADGLSNIVNSCTGNDRGNGKSDDDGHGTAVAGVVAGFDPEGGWQGIAPEAEIMPIDAFTAEIDGFFEFDIAAGIRFATDNGAKVVNMSLGCSQALNDNDCEIDQTVRAAMEYATSKGVAIVISAGNDGNDYFVGTDAALAGDPDMNGLVLAVGSIGPDSEVSSFSNSCTSNYSGFDQAYCIVAPGEDIETAGTNGGTVTVSGTSFSAPYVSGAIALLMSADPNLTAQEAIQIILMTADDPNSPNVGNPPPSEEITDDLFGNGILNLADALAPVGLVTAFVNAIDDLGNAGVSFSQPFGDALQNSTMLSEAVLFDMFDRAYVFDLTKKLEAVSTRANTGVFHSTDEPISATANASLGNYSFTANYRSETTEFDDDAEERLDFLVSHDAPDSPNWYMGFTTGGRDFRVDPASSAKATLNLTDTYSSLNLVGSETSFQSGLTWQKGKTQFHTSLSYLDDVDSVQFSAGIQHAVSQRAYAIVQLDYLNEENSFLGSEGTGSAEESYSAETLQMLLGLGWAVGKTDYYASYMYGRSDVSVSGASLFSSIDDLSITALSFSAARTDIWSTGDRFGITMGLPTRLASGTAKTAFESQNGGGDELSLKPSGIQKNVEIAYQTPLRGDAFLQFGAAAMIDPGHDADAATEYAVGLRLTTKF